MRRVKIRGTTQIDLSPLNYFNAVNVPSLRCSDVLSESLFTTGSLAGFSLCSRSLLDTMTVTFLFTEFTVIYFQLFYIICILLSISTFSTKNKRESLLWRKTEQPLYLQLFKSSFCIPFAMKDTINFNYAVIFINLIKNQIIIGNDSFSVNWIIFVLTIHIRCIRNLNTKFFKTFPEFFRRVFPKL